MSSILYDGGSDFSDPLSAPGTREVLRWSWDNLEDYANTQDQDAIEAAEAFLRGAVERQS